MGFPETPGNPPQYSPFEEMGMLTCKLQTVFLGHLEKATLLARISKRPQKSEINQAGSFSPICSKILNIRREKISNCPLFMKIAKLFTTKI